MTGPATMFVCPGCGVPTSSGTTRCVHCNIRLVGERALQLWRLDQQLDALRAQRAWLVEVLRGDDDVVPTALPTTGSETRRVLLGLGAVCLIAALTAGTALIWPALGVAGQTVVLLLVTALLLVGAVRMQQLPATAEALAAVGVAAVAVDVVAGRRLVAPDLSGAASHGYWLVGSLLAAVLLAGVATFARWLQAPAVGAVLATYGAVVAAVSPHSIGQVALVGVVGVAVSLVLLRLSDVMPAAVTATATVGGVVFAGTVVVASLVGAETSVLAMWCGLALGVAAAFLPPRAEAAAGGGLLVAVMLLFGNVIVVGSSALVTASVAAALLPVVVIPARSAWQPRATWFVFGGAVVVEIVEQLSMQSFAVQGSDLARAAVGLVIVAALAALATAWSWSRHEGVAGGFAVLCSTAIVGATAEALGVNGGRAAAEGAAIVAGGICVLALVVAAAEAAVVARLAGLVAAATGLWASIAVGASLGLHHVTTLEAYVVTPGLVCLALGLVALTRLPAVPSWVLMPAALVTLTPTLLLALRHDLDRQVVLLVVGAGLVGLGAQLRLVCPLAVGTTVVSVLTLRLLGPQIVQLPRWLTLSIIGAALILLGATWERRLQDMRNAADRVRPLVAALR